MKKIQIIRKNKKNNTSTRITNETVAQHRESILAGGRKFKYPVQYARHKLIINTIIISMIAIGLACLFIWHQLYVAQSSNSVLYRLTKIIPLPVATIDGKSVRYSDYLSQYLSQVHYLETHEPTNLRPETRDQQLNYIKNQMMNSVVIEAYAKKVAKEKGIVVSDDEVNSQIEIQRKQFNLSEGTFETTLASYFNWDMDEYKKIVQDRIYVKRVAFELDSEAKTIKADVESRISRGQSLEDISKELGDKVEFKNFENLPKNNADKGLTSAAVNLKDGQVSTVITDPGDGYYFIFKKSSGNDTVSYSYLKVSIKTLESYVSNLKNDGKVKYYINIQG